MPDLERLSASSLQFPVQYHLASGRCRADDQGMPFVWYKPHLLVVFGVKETHDANCLLVSFTVSSFLVHGSSRAHDQNRIIGMAHDRLGHTTEHPALHAGAAMRAHCDQRIEGFSRRCDNFVRFEALFSCE